MARRDTQSDVDRFLLCGLAELADYPGPTFTHALEESRRHARRLDAPARADLLQFVEWAASKRVEEVEEEYAATFDSNDACALELGWHLHGESYARGVMLVELRQRLRECGIEEGSELPDHVSAVLRWLAHARDRADATRWTKLSIVPALTRLVAGLERRRSPWRPLLCAIARVLDSSWTPADPAALATSAATLGSLASREPRSFDDEQRDGFEDADEARRFAGGCGDAHGTRGGCS
jgi:nitrate reductase delta subunit